MKVMITGSFNPFHIGHQYVYDVACKCFGKENVWIGVGLNPEKKEVNLAHIKRTLIPITKNVITYTGLTAEVVKQEGFELLIRGVRPGHNLDDENDLLYWNRKLCGVETILIPTPPELNQISSGAIRILHKNKQDVSELVNPFVLGRWADYPNPEITVYFGRCCSGKSTFLKNPRISRFDQMLWEDEDKSEEQIASLKDEARRLFYSKDQAFWDMVDGFGKEINWYRMFNRFPIIDFPNLGTYWEYIPKSVLAKCKFIKISTSMENRQYFAQCRGANPKLIETSDFFYRDPPFWDEEIIIEKES